ncbi:MAG: TetR/AcrR family transcriptional regulator [Coriobacteriia bacterium]|nr:TetR/AcrR family transcriptional regulator [Coriobacteriia bacterium]
MARPRKDQEGPSASERIEQAFWELLEEKKFHSITVRDLTGRAKVNRNTFYYHFESVEDLAAKAIQGNIPREFFSRLISMLLEGSFDASVVQMAPDLETRFHRVRLTMRNGSYALSAMVKCEVVRLWLECMQIGKDELTPSDWARFDFVWGGITSLIASDHVHSSQEYLAELEGGVAAAVSMLVVRIREGHSAS